jgi:hypothetical protein
VEGSFFSAQQLGSGAFQSAQVEGGGGYYGIGP